MHAIPSNTLTRESDSAILREVKSLSAAAGYRHLIRGNSMKAEEVYRQIVVALGRAGIVAPHIANLSDTREYSEKEAAQLAEEVVDYLEAELKHRDRKFR